MKKIVLASIMSLSLVGLFPYTLSQAVDVGNIVTKEAGDDLTADEFNTLLDTGRGIYTEPDPVNAGEYNIGLNSSPVDGVDLNIDGILKVAPYNEAGIPLACDVFATGMMYFNAHNDTFWGCDGSSWEELGVACTAPDPIPGICAQGVNNGCISGTLNDLNDTTENHLWECVGEYGGGTDSCSMAIPLIVNGECKNEVNNGCNAGLLDDLADTGTNYVWNCLGTSGGADDNCSKPIPLETDGVCGSSQYDWLTAQPTSGLCATGVASGMTTNAASYTWNCLSGDGGDDDSCTAFRGSEYTCMNDGSWVKGAHCAPSEYIANGIYGEDETICYVSTGTAHCLSVANEYTCQNDGTWSGAGSVCGEVDYDSSGFTDYVESAVTCSSVVPNDSFCVGTDNVCLGITNYESRCYFGDAYWYNDCETRGEKKEECGASSCEETVSGGITTAVCVVEEVACTNKPANASYTTGNGVEPNCNWSCDSGYREGMSGVFGAPGYGFDGPTCIQDKSPIAGVCGSSHEGVFSYPPTSNLCAIGTASTLSGGIYSSSGSPSGGIYSSSGSPSGGIYSSSGSPSYEYTWNCNGVNGGKTANCSAEAAACTNKPANASYDSGNGVSPNCEWSCDSGYREGMSGVFGAPGYGGLTCIQDKSSIAGVCGSSHEGVFSYPPTSNLCAIGTASTLSGGIYSSSGSPSYEYTWNCNGVNGGKTANCSAEAAACTNKPANASYTTGNGVSPNCNWSCDSGYANVAGSCVVEEVACTNKPANASYTTGNGVSPNCNWSCDSGYTNENGSCVVEEVACTNKPANSSYTTGNGVSPNCNWSCDSGYELDALTASGNPGSGFESPTCEPIAVACTNKPTSNASYNSGNGVEPNCNWSCDSGYANVAGSCAVEEVACTNKPTSNASYNSGNGVSPNCNWSCDSGYTNENGSCVVEEVACTNKPTSNASYNSGNGVSPNCNWSCDSGYTNENGSCVAVTYACLGTYTTTNESGTCFKEPVGTVNRCIESSYVSGHSGTNAYHVRVTSGTSCITSSLGSHYIYRTDADYSLINCQSKNETQCNSHNNCTWAYDGHVPDTSTGRARPGTFTKGCLPAQWVIYISAGNAPGTDKSQVGAGTAPMPFHQPGYYPFGPGGAGYGPGLSSCNSYQNSATCNLDGCYWVDTGKSETRVCSDFTTSISCGDESGCSWETQQVPPQSNWQVTTWSTCNAGSQSRTVTCPTGSVCPLEEPASSQSCTTTGGGSIKLICGELYRQGLLSKELWIADNDYANKYIDPKSVELYKSWARPFVSLMQKSTIATKMAEPFGVGWAEHMAYLEGTIDQDNFLGKSLQDFFLPIHDSLAGVKSVGNERASNADATFSEVVLLIGAFVLILIMLLVLFAPLVLIAGYFWEKEKGLKKVGHAYKWLGLTLLITLMLPFLF